MGRKVILDIDTDISGRDYLAYKARQYGITTIHNSLEGCLQGLREFLFDLPGETK